MFVFIIIVHRRANAVRIRGQHGSSMLAELATMPWQGLPTLPGGPPARAKRCRSILIWFLRLSMQAAVFDRLPNASCTNSSKQHNHRIFAFHNRTWPSCRSPPHRYAL